MLPATIFLLLATLVQVQCVENRPTNKRVIHRLVGGHLNGRNPQDDELMIASESGGQNKKSNGSGGEEEKKTLAQQVAEGKYGLIQKELFSKPIKRPGVISYDSNSEVPKDSITNLGGLSKNDIWLAENHLLVIKGGVFPPHDDHQDSQPQAWPPIDNYVAPERQVKIPSNPKVPPPFPVQLEEGGPLQIIGTNYTRTLNGSLESPPYSILPPEGLFPFYPEEEGPNSPNAPPGKAPFPIPPFPPGISGEFHPGNGPPPFPVNGSFLPFFPPGNQTEPIDEDDPSIYYPPPYSFYYPKDNSSVPAGPLVPGIVLPPPPNFFAPLEEEKKKPTTKKPTTTTARPTTTTKQFKQIHPTTTPLAPTSVVGNFPKAEQPQVVTIYPIKQITRLNNNTIVITTTAKPYTPVVRNPSHNRKKPPSVTILKPVKATTQPPSNYYYENEVSRKPFDKYGPPISTTQVPLKIYFSTSNEIEQNSVTPKNKYYTQQPKTTTRPPPAQYYYYEEEGAKKPQDNGGNQNQYFNIPNHYLIRAKPAPRPVEVEIQQVPAQLPEDRYRIRQQVEFKPLQQNYYQGNQDNVEQNQPYKPSNQASNPSNQGYNPSSQGYTSSNQGYKPPNQGYNPSHQVYNPPSQIYTPNNQQYIPPKQKYTPHQAYTPPNQPYTPQPQVVNNQEPQYVYVTNRPYVRSEKPHFRLIQTTNKPSDSFGYHIAKIKEQIQSYYTTERPYRNSNQNTNKPSSKPVYQFSFQAANYKKQHDAFQNTQYDDNDKFRPLPHYSVQIQPAVEVIPTEPPAYRPSQSPIYFREKQPSSQKPRPIYYSTQRPQFDYQEQNTQGQYTATPRPVSQYSFEATPNPVYQQGFYTKQDEGYFDDNTKKYFTIFGKKIPGVTTPIAYAEPTTLKPVQVEYAQSIRKPVASLHGDTLVNYVQQRPTNPDAEYIKYLPQQDPQTSLHSDINVNYKDPQPPINPNAEIVRAIPVKLSPQSNPDNKGGSYISYQLPGDDGAHFYFLTPQLAQKRNQGVGYYFSQPNTSARIRRNNRDKES